MFASGNLGFFTRFFRALQKTKITLYAAAMSFAAVFSIFPFIILFVALSGVILESQLTQGEILRQVGLLTTPEISQTLRTVMGEATGKGAGSLSIISGILLLISGTRLFDLAQASLNEIFQGEAAPNKGWLHRVEKKAFSFIFFIGAGFILTLSFFMEATFGRIQEILHDTAPSIELILSIENFSSIFSTGFFFISCAIAYRYLPRAEIKWEDVWLGALATTGIFFLGKEALGFYFAHSPIRSFYGAAGSFVILLIWIYFISLSFLAGGEVCAAYAEAYGSKRKKGLSFRF